MKKVIFIFCYFLCFSSLYGQNKFDTTINNLPTNSLQDIKMTAHYGSDNQETTDILKFQNIDFHRVSFIGKGLKETYFSLVAKEIWDGKVKRIDTVINTKTRQKIGSLQSDTLLMNVYGKPEGKELKLSFDFPQKLGIIRKYKATQSDDYSLRAIGQHSTIQKGKPFYAFAYILPYEADGWKMYCEVDQNKDIENWGKTYRIKHYIIFEMTFQ